MSTLRTGRRVVFDISEHSFTRLSGYFGRTSGTGSITMSVVCLDWPNRVLGEFHIPANVSPQRIDVFLPTGTRQIRIDMMSDGNNTGTGFGSAYFMVLVANNIGSKFFYHI